MNRLDLDNRKIFGTVPLDLFQELKKKKLLLNMDSIMETLLREYLKENYP